MTLPGGDPDDAAKAGDAGTPDEQAGFPRPLAEVLDPPVGVVADATGLADDDVSGSHHAVDAM